jgi:hypothetical protein
MQLIRWMGSTRFAMGFVAGVMSRRKYPCELQMRVVSDDKEAIARGDYPRRDEEENSEVGEGLPPLKYGTVNDTLPKEGWTTINKPIISVYSGERTRSRPRSWRAVFCRLPEMLTWTVGTMPYLAPDLLQFPAARRDGLIDLTLVFTAPRTKLLLVCDLSNMLGVEKAYWVSKVDGWG